MRTKLVLGVSIAFLLLGIVFILNPPPISYITAIMDTSPPVISATTPANGITYVSIPQVNCTCTDPESGISEVSLQIDANTADLMSVTGNTYYATTSASWGTANTAGSHSFTFTVTNGNGLQTVVSGTYAIYTGMTGAWTVNGISITSPTQVLRLTTLTLSFSFTKTAGSAPDSAVSATVSWTGPATGSLTLSNTASHQWTGSYTFTTGGSYTVTLRAYDGTTTITFAILDAGLQISTISFPSLLLVQYIGIMFAAIGSAGTVGTAIYVYTKRKH
jgi:hypothetical protein